MALLTGAEKGVFPISVTPFHDDGAIDLDSMDRLTDYFLGLKVPGLTLLGIMGEANKLTGEESLLLVRRVAKRLNGRAKLIVGATQLGYDAFSSFAREAMEAGASGIMVAPPAPLRTEENVASYFEGLIAKLGADVPLVLQDYPQNSGVYLSVATIERLLRTWPSIKILKHEEGSALRKISRLRKEESSGARRRVCILVGNSGIHLPQELARGADGANTGVAYPEMLIEVCDRFAQGKADAAEDLYDIFLPIIRHEQQPGIGLAIRKEIFRRRGLISSARARGPGPALDADDRAELMRLLQRLDRKLRAAGEDRILSADLPIGL